MADTLTLNIEPLSDVLGAEVTGVDLAREPDEATKTALRDGWRRHHMLLFPEQTMSDTDHVRFCEIFGPVQQERTSPQLSTAEQPSIHYVANTQPDAILPDGDILLHSDQCHYDLPAMATTLHAFEVPSDGGETFFTNAHLAYDALTDGLKRRCDGLRAENAYKYESPNRQHKVTDSWEPEAQRAAHPVIRTHPETGRKAIFVNRLMTDFIVGMGTDESRALLEELYTYVEDTRLSYQHKWRVGDL
ncbi:MAG: TauD/TfdA family dioxygenase, partial [Alphaproteobacteria bacterium]